MTSAGKRAYFLSLLLDLLNSTVLLYCNILLSYVSCFCCNNQAFAWINNCVLSKYWILFWTCSVYLEPGSCLSGDACTLCSSRSEIQDSAVTCPALGTRPGSTNSFWWGSNTQVACTPVVADWLAWESGNVHTEARQDVQGEWYWDQLHWKHLFTSKPPRSESISLLTFWGLQMYEYVSSKL